MILRIGKKKSIGIRVRIRGHLTGNQEMGKKGGSNGGKMRNVGSLRHMLEWVMGNGGGRNL